MHAINIISGISMLGVLIGSAAFVIILSGFNGLEVTILSLYSNFTPEIKIEPRLGKTFEPNTAYFNTLHHDERVFSYTEVLQEKVLIKYNDKPFIGSIKGVTREFLANRQLDSIIQAGKFTLKAGGQNFAPLFKIASELMYMTNLIHWIFTLQTEQAEMVRSLWMNLLSEASCHQGCS